MNLRQLCEPLWGKRNSWKQWALRRRRNARMPEGSEFQTESAVSRDAESTGGESCADPRNRRQMDYGGS